MDTWEKYLSTEGPLVCLAKESIHTVGYAGSRPSLACQDCLGGYHSSREGIRRHLSSMLRKHKLGEGLLIQLILPILIQKPSLWHTCSVTLGIGYSFPVDWVKQAAHPKGPKNTTIRAIGGFTQIWDGFMWFTPGWALMYSNVGSRKKKKKHSKIEPSQVHQGYGMDVTITM